MQKCFLVGVLGFGVVSHPCVAAPHPALETNREQVALARICVILDHVTPLIEEAQRYQNPQARVQFRYDQLQRDIDAIKAGIQAKFHPNWMEARSLSTIDGDYLCFKRKAR